MSKSEANKKYTAREDVVFTDLDDGSAVLLHLQTKYYYSLNETGCFLWKVLDGDEGGTEERMVLELTENFDVDKDRARADVREFIQELIEQGLID